MVKIKIGVVGGGHIVKHRHLPIYRKIKEVEVAAVCDKEEAIAKGVADQFQVRSYYTDLSKMLAKEKLDVVDICTPPKTHVALALQAMDAGCHVLVEKPLAMNVDEVDRMFSHSGQKHVKLCVVHQNLFNPVVRKAKALVESGAVGDLISVEVAALVRRDNYMCLNRKHWCHTLPGGLNFEVLPHPVYLLQSFLADPEPVCLVAKKISDSDWMKAEEIRVLMEAKKGMGLIVSSCNSPYHGDQLNILGTRLGLQIDLWGRTVIKNKVRTEEPLSVGRNNLYMASQFLKPLAANLINVWKMASSGVKVSAHYDFIMEFVRSIMEDRDPPVTPSETRKNVEIVEKICSMIDDYVSEEGLQTAETAQKYQAHKQTARSD